MAEVLEWETASGRFEGRKPAVQPRDRRPEEHQKQDKQQCVTPPGECGLALEVVGFLLSLQGSSTSRGLGGFSSNPLPFFSTEGLSTRFAPLPSQLDSGIL
jgi:hypothetical protein